MRRLLAVIAVGSIVLAACSSNSGGSGGSTGTGSGESPTPSVSTTESPSPSESPKPPLPTAVENPKQGGTYFGVYLAVGPSTDPKLVTAAQEAASLGYRAFPSDISCDHGAAQALGVSNNLFVVVVYFEHRGQVNDFVFWLNYAFDRAPLGVVRVQTFCAG
jgi:hypothetical protein